MKIEEHKSLKQYNTFGIDVKSDFFVSINNINDLKNLINTEIFQNNKSFILGGGSNVLFTNDFQDLIININIKGISIIKSTDDYIVLEAGAGEDWSKFVETCVRNNYHGNENLAMIPGKVGAAPVQNIGAYGMEQKDIFFSLKGFNLENGENLSLGKDDCNFAYRSSIFKNELKEKMIVTSVQYKLSKKKDLNLSYKELLTEINKFPVKEIDQRLVFDTVCRLRRSKLPDPTKIGNAGSFFKNPIVNNKKFNELKNKFPEIPSYQFNEYYKIPAGWLIEQCGWKGKKIGDTGVYEKHALILVNYGNANGKEILKLAKEITNSVKDKFGILLEPEVQIIKNYRKY
jgi:UDP-N-acetylmuramate dehydrogenase